MKISLILPIAALGLVLEVAATGPISTANAQQEQIYGSQLMTEQERSELRTQMRAATSNEAREQIRWEHHIKMQERATDRGVKLPDEPPMFGMRQHQGGGGGQGRLRLPQGGGGRRGG